MGMRVQKPQDQFELARKRAQQSANAAKQTQSDALQRRFAAQGMTGSGAAIKQQRIANESVDKQLADTSEGIDAAQQQEFARKGEIEDQRNFAREERNASQTFAEKQRLGSQTFAEKQRLGSQEYSAIEAKAARDAQKAQFDADLGFRQSAATTSGEQFEKQFGLAQEQFKQDRIITGLNAQIAAKEAGVNWTGFGDGSNGNITTPEIDKKLAELSAKNIELAAFKKQQDAIDFQNRLYQKRQPSGGR